MSKRKKKRKKRQTTASKAPPKSAGLGFLLGALGVGVLCIVVGIVVLVLGVSYTRGGTEVTAKEASKLAYWLIALGVAAIGLTILIYRMGK